jgi:hypothetical protein
LPRASSEIMCSRLVITPISTSKKMLAGQS